MEDQENYNNQHNHDGINSQRIQSKYISGLSGQVVASNDLTGRNSAVNSLFDPIYTVPNDRKNHTYSVGGYITVTAVSVNTITLQVIYTDETGASRTQSFFGEGLTVAAISTVSATAFPPMTIRAKYGTVITIKTTIVGAGAETYDIGAYLIKIN